MNLDVREKGLLVEFKNQLAVAVEFKNHVSTAVESGAISVSKDMELLVDTQNKTSVHSGQSRC